MPPEPPTSRTSPPPLDGGMVFVLRCRREMPDPGPSYPPATVAPPRRGDLARLHFHLHEVDTGQDWRFATFDEVVRTVRERIATLTRDKRS